MAHTLVIHVVDKCLNIRNLPAMWRLCLCLQAQHHKIAKDIKKIQTNNVQKKIFTVGRGQLFLMRWRREGFDKTQIPGQLIILLTPCTVLTVLLLKVLQFSSLIKKCKLN